MSLFVKPSDETRDKVAFIHLSTSNLYDVMDNKLNRVKGLSGILASASAEGERTGLSHSEVYETARAICDETEMVLCLLEQWSNDNRTKPPAR